MRGLILRRLAQLPLILLVIYTITLALAWAVPGNPLENPEGRQPPAAVVEAMKRQYNLDSFPRFYTSYLTSATGLDYAGDLISEVALAIEMGCDAVDLGHTIHPHPTLSETVNFAAEMFEGTITDLMPPKKKKA